MPEISRRISLRFLLLFFSIFLQFLPGFSDDSKSEKDIKVEDGEGSPRNKHGSTIFMICIVLAAVVTLSFFLFKLYQKKKREEQYARLLRLFEEDDELELELGLRD